MKKKPAASGKIIYMRHFLCGVKIKKYNEVKKYINKNFKFIKFNWIFDNTFRKRKCKKLPVYKSDDTYYCKSCMEEMNNESNESNKSNESNNFINIFPKKCRACDQIALYINPEDLSVSCLSHCSTKDIHIHTGICEYKNCINYAIYSDMKDNLYCFNHKKIHMKVKYRNNCMLPDCKNKRYDLHSNTCPRHSEFNTDQNKEKKESESINIPIVYTTSYYKAIAPDQSMAQKMLNTYVEYIKIGGVL